jgi:DNA modification methylase
MDLCYLLTRSGWDFLENIIWRKPQASVKNRNAQFFNHRKPLTYKPNLTTEDILVFRKHTDKLIDWNLKKYSKEIIEKSSVEDGYETTDVWEIQPKSSKYHPAIFPDELVEKVIRYYSMAGDVVLDPFNGIGTTCKVAKKLGRQYVGIELNEDYYKYSLTNVV